MNLKKWLVLIWAISALLISHASWAAPMTYGQTKIAEFGHLILNHPDYLNAPQRIMFFSPAILEAAEKYQIPPEDIAGILYLESAAHPEKCARPFNVRSACGIAQIEYDTAVNYLGLKVDLKKSQRISKKINKMLATGASWDSPKLNELLQERRRVDDRFDPYKSIDAMGKYLSMSRERLGRIDFSIASYHMGTAGVEKLICIYLGIPYRMNVSGLVIKKNLSFPKVYYDCRSHPHSKCWRYLSTRADSSHQYFWKVQAGKWFFAIWHENNQEYHLLFTQKAYDEYHYSLIDLVGFDY